VGGKGYFQQFDLMDYGTMLGMGAYLGPDFSTEFLHRRAVFLADGLARREFGKAFDDLNEPEASFIRALVKNDVKDTPTLNEDSVAYSAISTDAFKANRDYLVSFLVDGNQEAAWVGGVIRAEEAIKIAAFVDWAQLVASTNRPGTDRSWSNNWPPEPLIGQDTGWNSHFWSLWELLALWVGTILVLVIAYEKLLKAQPTDEPASAMVISKLFPSQEKLLKYVPVVGLFMLLQMILGGYLAHIYTDPGQNFIFSQEHLPFNVMRALHVNLAIIWVAIGWLVGGMLIAPMAAEEDLKFPGVLAFLTVALGLVSRKSAERIMLFELFLVAASGILGVGHHYWWQGLDEYWIAVGGIFSALEPLPLALLMIEAFKQQRVINKEKGEFPFAIPFLFLAGSAFLNWYGAGFLGMVINLPTINYYAHGTYLIMPHGHVALLGAFGYISIAFMYLTVRTNAIAKGHGKKGQHTGGKQLEREFDPQVDDPPPVVVVNRVVGHDFVKRRHPGHVQGGNSEGAPDDGADQHVVGLGLADDAEYHQKPHH